MLPRSLAQTLFLVITLLAFVVVLAMAGLVRVSLQHGFRAYVQSAELQRLAPLARELEQRYQAQGSWDFLSTQTDLGRAVHEGLAGRAGPGRDGASGLGGPGPQRPFPGAGGPPDSWQGGPPTDMGPPPYGAYGMPGPGRDEQPPRPGRDTLSLGLRAALLDIDGSFVAGNRAARSTPRRALYVEMAGQRRLIGYLVLTEPPAAQRQAGEEFVASQLQNLGWISALVLLLSAAVAVALAAYFRRPIRALAEGTRRIAGGDFAARLPELRRDELGRMAGDFNRMAEKLEAFEQARRQWMADSSHELRTPLTVLSTHLEAMRDGVIPTSPERLAVLSRTVEDMNRLVNDLYQLATADAGAHDYRYECVSVAGLLAELESSFTPRLEAAQLRLKVHDGTPPGSCVRADRLRLMQVLGNLLTNSARYTDAGGEVVLTALRWQERIEFVVEDSAPGVPPEALPRLFDRFYRVDVSRSRKSGGSGLGLAICRAIVQAHGGRIAAGASPLGGLRVAVSLPAATAGNTARSD